MKHILSGETGNFPTSLLPSKNRASSEDVSCNVVLTSPAHSLANLPYSILFEYRHSPVESHISTFALWGLRETKMKRSPDC